MDAQTLKEHQSPLKEKYRADPNAALVTLKAKSGLDAEGIACSIEVGGKLAAAGLHPATGGSGAELCSGNMLLEALAACADVTLRAVATVKGLDIKGGALRSKAIWTFAARSGSTRRCRLVSRRSACASRSRATQRRIRWRRSSN